ncbi:MAG TPA: non-ribosomal peptide synthase/polyketide synthase [Candidatus Angelobacter sp.]|nr:non-ribosomal peptide synthase/polyketide synthase [Candidatus Angelobacter sp.]
MRSEYSDLTQLLLARAKSSPDQVAFTFLRDGESDELNWTYAELVQRARGIAASLQSANCANQRVLLLYPPGLDFIAGFWGCLLAGAIAVPAYPPASSRTLSRLYAIAKDCQAAAVLSTEQILATMRAFAAVNPALSSLYYLATDELPLDAADGWKRQKVSSDSIALLQYTSGSTATPKGVMVSHANLLHNEILIQKAFRQSQESIIVGWLPLYHDMGLIGNVMQPIHLGARCILMSPISFLQSPVRWLRAISRYHATTSGGPNFAYNLCARKVSQQEEEGLDLSRWSVAFNGAEAVRDETLNRFAERFAKVGFKRDAFAPCYGLAEATLLVSGPADGKPATTLKVDAKALAQNRIKPTRKIETAHTLVSSGKAAAGVKLQIVEPESRTMCAAGQVGEIWVTGKSVAQGYWARVEESEKVFGARIAGSDKGPFLRTGDLGFLRSGELFVTGRLKDLIIIRGRNLYPQDIEATVERAHAGLRPGCAAAFSVETESGEGMVVVQEVERGRENDTAGMTSAIRSALVKHHEVQPHAILLLSAGEIPKTSSGKIQRYKCRNQFIAGEFKPVAQWHAKGENKEATAHSARNGNGPASSVITSAVIEEWLVVKLSAIAKVAPSEISVNTPITQYGIDSLAAVELAHAMTREWGIAVPLTSLLQEISIRELASELAGTAQPAACRKSAERATEMVKPGESNDVVLSEGQKALWFLYQLDPESTAYNLSFAARIAVDIDGAMIRRAVQALVDRHDALRTTFRSVEGVPMQRIHDSQEVSFTQFEAADWDEATLQGRIEEQAGFHFNLEQGPLFKVAWFRRGKSGHVICVTAHHIIADLWSLALLIRELTSLCAAAFRGQSPSLPLPASKYRDYVKWQQEMLAGEDGERMRSYWEGELAGELPVLNLPTDHPRPAIQSCRGASKPFQLSQQLSKAVQDLSVSKSATVYTTLLAAFQALMYRYSGQNDIVIGSPAAGRNRAEWANVFGYFVNPLVLRARISDDLTFAGLMQTAKRTVLNALAHQDYPFFSLVERLQPVRDLSRSPLFQAMFIFEKTVQEEGISAFALGQAGVRAELNGVVLESVAIPNKPSQFDLQFTMAEVGNLLHGSIHYNPEIFDESTIERMAKHWEELLQAAVSRPETAIRELPLLTSVERQELLVERNATVTPYPAHESVSRIFEATARRYPDNVALEFAGARMTYSELNERANQIAHYLRGLGIGPERPVAVCLQRSPELIEILLGILKAGGAYVPLDTAYPQERIEFMLEDSGSDFVITQTALRHMLPGADREVICLEEVRPAITEAKRNDLQEAPVGQNLAYVMYTSGSTGVPKGVAVLHQNITRLVKNTGYASFGPEEVFFLFAPVSFDASTFEIWGALLNGGKLAICPPANPSLSELSGLLEKHQVTTLWLTAGLFRLMVDEQLSGLAHLRQLLAGGDVLSVEHVKMVASSGVRLINGYGPTENTTFSCCYTVTDESALQNTVPIGKPIANTEAYVLDANLQLAPMGVVGELYLGGDGLARGYLGRPDVTAERFVPHPYSSKEGARLYRSGDWVRWNTAGQLEFIGRKDGQIKLRGFRVELGEIETALRQQAGVKQAVVLMREEHEDKRLVAYVVTESEIGFAELREGLRKRLPEHMVPSGWVRLEQLPLTSNGKLDHRALPMPAPETEKGYVAPRNGKESQLVEIWKQVLGLEQLGVEDNFFELGGHSLKATQVVARVRTALGIELPLRAVFEAPTIAALAERLIEAGPGAHGLTVANGAAPQKDFALSYAQQRLWFLHQMEPEQISYNLPGSARIRGRLDVDALHRAFQEVTRRHESLRTCFVSIQGEPRQVIDQESRLELALIDLTSFSPEHAAEQLKDIEWQESRTPFDLERGPLVRLKLLRFAPEEHVLLVTMHHIVSDGWSFKILLHELKALYEAFAGGKESPLREPSIQYSDFAVWQREWLSSDRLEEQVSYWTRQLAAAPTRLDMPTDHSRPVVQSTRGVRQPVTLDKKLEEKLRKLCQEQSVTLYMALLAAFQTLLYRYTGQQDIIVGSPIAGRGHAETEGLIGFFVNTLAMRTELSGDLTFSQLLQRVKKTALDAYANQDLPFEKLVETLSPERDMASTPFFQVVFGLQDGQLPEIQFGQATVQMSPVDNGTAKFDLTLLLEESEAGIQGFLEYCTDLFTPSTIQRMLAHFNNLLSAIASDPHTSLAALPMLGNAERQQLLVEWNSTAADFPHKCVHDLLTEQAKLTPAASAVVFEGRNLSYAELDKESNQIGRYLRKLGAGPETRIGICVERSLEAVAGLVGILKSGAAFVPLDPDYPAERLRYMIADAGIEVLMSHKNLTERFPDFSGRIVSLDADWPAIANEDFSPLAPMTIPENLAYVMYTSGSTGLPKGVGVAHASIVRLVKNTQYVDFSQARTFLQFAPISFDASTFEIWGALLNGAQLVVFPPGLPSLSDLGRFVQANAIDTMWLTAPLFHQMMETEAPSLKGVKQLLAGGDIVSPQVAAKALSAGNVLINGYGPTENTTFSACYRMQKPEDIGHGQVPIGTPIANTQTYVLDKEMQPVPAGVAGELLIGGAGLSRGYINRPELTAEKFVPHPFSGKAGERLYRTGDLVRWTPDGKLDFIGRVDRQIKVRGFRVELGEIEEALRQHSSVKDAAVLALEQEGAGRQLIAYVAVSGNAEITHKELSDHLRISLPEYMLPAGWVLMEQLPTTANGKVDAKALEGMSPEFNENRDHAQDGTDRQRTPIEEIVCGIWEQVLKVSPVGVNDSFFELGGHSLLATQIMSRVERFFSVHLPLRTLFETPTVREMAGRIEHARNTATEVQLAPLHRIDREQPLPLSFAQQRLWFIDRLESGSASYNVAGAWQIQGPLDVEAVHKSFQEIVRRHESLRTRFEVVRGEPRQVIEKEVLLNLPVVDLTAVPLTQRDAVVRKTARADVEQGFDLQHAPLIRAKLLRLAEEEHLLLVTIHHIVFDGWSLSILAKEFAELYQAYKSGEESPIPELAVQYGDFAVWQREWLQGAVLEEQLGFWKKQLSGVAALEIPRDFPRPPMMSHRGGSLKYALTPELTRKLKQASRQEGVSLFMTLLAAFNVLLSRYAGVEDISVGTPIANRNRVEIENLIGYFVNTLVLRTDVSGNPSWRELLERTRQTTLEAYQHQDMPFEKLVEELQPARDLSRTPLFQNFLVLQNTGLQDLRLHGLTIKAEHPERSIAKYDLEIDLSESEAGLKGFIDYALDLFEEPTIRNFGNHFRAVLETLANHPQQPIAQLSLLAESERQQLLHAWNQTATQYPREKFVHELFEEQARTRPQAVAARYEEAELTYAELNRRANQAAHYLRKLGVRPEERVGVCVERSLEMAIGLLGVLKAGGVYVPLDPSYPAERLQYMVEDSRPLVVLTQAHLRELFSAVSDRAALVEMDAGTAVWSVEEESNLEISHLSAENAAYVIYTSGSTGRPKGVVVEHKGLVNTLVHSQKLIDVKGDDVIAALSSGAFDISILEMMTAWLGGGCTLIIHRPAVLDMEQLLRSLQGVTVLHTVPALMGQIVEAWRSRGSDGSPSGLRKVLTGGDSVPVSVLKQLKEVVPAADVRVLYGPTEAAMICTNTDDLRKAPEGVAGGIGQAIANMQVYVLDGEGEPVPVGVLGELYLGGIGLARGYANRPELTAEKFVPDPHSGAAGARLYRTGDLVRWRRNGTLQFAGRSDNQIKLRGYRIELAEIERVILESGAVQQTVVIVRGEDAEEKRLVAYVVPAKDASIETERLADSLRHRLPAYMIPSNFVEMAELPITVNGKIDRNALPEPKSGNDNSYAAPQTAHEEILCGIVAEVLEVPRVGLDDNFFDLGGHSLLATLVISRVRGVFGVELPLQSLFESPTVRSMAEHLKEELAAAGQSVPVTGIQRVERDGSPLPLSYAQQRLWFIDQMEPGSALYNIPLAGKVTGKLDKNALQKSFNEIVRRHEVLRARFAVSEGVPVVEIVPDQQLMIEEIDLRGLSESERKAEALSLAEAETAIGFDLANGPLIRMKLLQMGEGDHVLLMTIHHIVSDGLSFKNFFAELGSLYEAYIKGAESPLEELEIQYSDFAAWQRQWLQGKTLDDQLAYWTKHLAGLQVLDLPTDYPRPALPHHRGANIRFEMSAELTARLKELSSRQEATLFMVMLAAFDALLFRYSGQEDIAVGSPIANRNRKEIENLIGFFVNTLVLRADVTHKPSFVELLRRVKKATLDAYANQDLPFEKLVEAVSPERDISRTPLFQVVFAMQSAPLAEVPLGDLKLQLFNVNSSTAKFDLTLGVVEDGGTFKASLEYNTDLFEPDTAQRMVDHYLTLLEGIVSEPERPIVHLPMLTQAEQRQLAEWNRTDAEWQKDKCLPEFFEEQARRIPTATAAEFQGQQLSYHELDRRSNQLGRYLQKLGAAPEVRVGICLERGLDLIVSLMAVQKAGAAYVPLDPNYPAERVSYMLEDSQATVLLTQSSLLDRMPAFAGQVVALDLQSESIRRESDVAPPRRSLPQNLAYVIYTSGSTGKPKGVAISHSSVAAFISWCHQTFSSLELSGVLASTSICFDVSIFETFVPLSLGGTLMVVGNVLDVERMQNPERVKVISTVPSAMRELVAMKAIPASVITVNLGGEAVPVGLAPQIYEGTSVERVLNMYGPTEDTTYSTCAWLPREADIAVPIGRPITNSKVYVLDSEMQQVPVGVTGDIYISGAGLARGYLTHPEWTAEKFIPNPFSDTPGGRLYRVGDLGKYRPDGQLGYLGRNDFQVKVRGHRIELGEIETAFEEIEKIAQAVVMAREKEQGEKELVAYLVMSSEISGGEIRERLRSRLPDYMLPSIFVRMESLPLTPNGKIDRRALPAPSSSLRTNAGGYVAPASPLEELLADIWAQVLGLERIGVDDNFFARGGHSLLATQVVARMRNALNVDIPLPRIFETPTIGALAAWIEQKLQGATEKISPIVPVPREDSTVLSYTQKRLWFISELEPDGTSYNLPAAVRIEGSLDVPALQKSLQEVVRRHHALRTRFVVINGEPRQVIDDDVQVEMKLVSLEHVPANELQKRMDLAIHEEADKPFNLRRGPLVRVGLLRLAEREHVLMVTMHHIVADDWSMGILVRELSALYGAFSAGRPSPLTELLLQYTDFSVWQQKALNGEVLGQQLEYWKTQLAGLQALELPTDRARPAAPSGKGGRVSFTLTPELTKQLTGLGRRHNATLYMTLLAAYQTLLFHYSGQTDIAVGTSVAGRAHTEIEGLIGCFINMLVLRTDLSGEPTFIELLKRVKDVTLGAYAHQDVPFEKLVETLQPDRDLSRPPLFQVMLVFHNTPQSELQLGNASLQVLNVESASTKFDLTLFVSEEAGALKGVLDYSADLFDAESIARLVKDFKTVLSAAASSPEKSIAAISLTAEDEREQLLAAWNEAEDGWQEEDSLSHFATSGD